jgi:nitrate reductase NapE component
MPSVDKSQFVAVGEPKPARKRTSRKTLFLQAMLLVCIVASAFVGGIGWSNARVTEFYVMEARAGAIRIGASEARAQQNEAQALALLNQAKAEYQRARQRNQQQPQSQRIENGTHADPMRQL